ncbi:hypothetical protein ZWY2020_041228 [Hordeum vulgare]|nr:hypothetical protein ZWY2020_041228 [Hordeum vulgare]
MATATTTTALSMKLLIDTKARRVLFAEASKDVVDFLFSLLALPVGTAVKLLGNDAMVGCVGSLYGSVERLDGTYVQPGASKDALLHPSVLSPRPAARAPSWACRRRRPHRRRRSTDAACSATATMAVPYLVPLAEAAATVGLT